MKTIIKKNPVQQIIKDKAPYGFIPTSNFYNIINVKRKMWAMLLRGEKEPTLSQLRAICDYFKVEIKDYIN